MAANIIAISCCGLATHSAARGKVAGRSLGRAGSEGAKVGETLGSAQVVGNRVAVRAPRKLEGRALSSHDVCEVAVASPGLAISSEVKRGSSAQSPLVHVQG